MKKLSCLICLAAGFAGNLLAVVPEPDSVIYGLVFVGTNQVSQITAANTNVVVEARRSPTGPALASYSMGSRPAVGDYYSLRVSVESVRPVVAPQAFQTGDTVYLTVVDPSGVQAQQTVAVGARGQIMRVDFNGANYRPDWLQYLRHPADNAPADNTITFGEVSAYSTAWKTGQGWPQAPNPIPIGYVARAGNLYLGGGGYVFDSSQATAAPTNAPSWRATNSPLWWANSVPATPPAAGNTVVRSVSAVYQPGTPLTVTNTVTCNTGVGAYAVEDQPPAGWQVSQISDGGVFDTVNQKVKWGLFMDGTSRTLSYTITPPAGATGDAAFAGQGGFDGLLVAITGDAETGPPPAGTVASGGLVAGKAFQLKLKGTPGSSQNVESSTDLINWTPLATAVLDNNGLWDFTDTNSTHLRERFFRITPAAQ
jgi:hypothetical protein